MQKMLLTIENTNNTDTKLSTHFDVKNLTLCADGDTFYLWHNNQAQPLKCNDIIIYQAQRFKVHLIEEREIEAAARNLNWLNPLQADIRHQQTLLPNFHSNSLTNALDPLAFLSPTNHAPDIFAPLAARQSYTEPQLLPAPHYLQSNKPKLFNRLKNAGKKLWQSTTPGTNQW